MVIKIAVIGAGANGLASAVKIKEKYKSSKVVLISDKFTPDTTGDGSGGLWHPYLCGTTPDHLLTKWGLETFNYLHKLWLEGDYDICLVPVFYLSTQPSAWLKQSWGDKVFGYKTLGEKDLKYLSKMHSHEYTGGHTFTTFIVSPKTVLGSLMKQHIYMGGEVVQAKVSSLQDPILNEFDVVVNCTGLGAKWIVPDDGVIPIRGQIALVTAPWIHTAVLGHDGVKSYILPNVSFCVMGGTSQANDYNTNVDEKDSEFILKGCKQIMPSLEKAEIQRHWVGLRPGRHEIRLESEQRNGKLYIHNYGHGGSGLTLFWGCATDVVALLDGYYKQALSKL